MATPDQLPHDLEAEKAVLGSCMLDAQALATAAEMLTPVMFYRQAHASIFAAMLDLADEGRPVDLMTLVDELRARNQLDRVGGMAYVTEIQNTVPTAAHVEHYARIVRAMYQRRQLIRVASELQFRAQDLSVDLDELLDRAEQAVFAVSRDGGADDPMLLDQVIQERFQQLYETRGEPPDTIRTGFRDLDALTGGLQRGALSILAARPSMGKSLLAQQIAANVSRTGYVLFFTAEMGKSELADRMISQWTGIDLVRIRTKRLTPPEWETTRKVLESKRVGWCWVDDQTDITTREIRARARRLAAQQPLDLIVVDYLQYLADQPERGESRNDLIGRMTRRLKALARELNCAMLLLSQLSRAPEKRATRRPELADLRDSGNIEQDADLVLLLHRPAYYDPEDRPGIAEVLIAKQRNGPTGMVELQFDQIRGFRDLEKRHVA
ncbi:MAG TPA: replicative DNA helicase, partial [Thermaerobacter sp.]